jgi:hypothetical protein
MDFSQSYDTLCATHVGPLPDLPDQDSVDSCCSAEWTDWVESRWCGEALSLGPKKSILKRQRRKGWKHTKRSACRVTWRDQPGKHAVEPVDEPVVEHVAEMPAHDQACDQQPALSAPDFAQANVAVADVERLLKYRGAPLPKVPSGPPPKPILDMINAAGGYKVVMGVLCCADQTLQQVFDKESAAIEQKIEQQCTFT